MNIANLKIGQSAKITKVGETGSLRQHFLDMGLIPGTEVTLVKLAPMGDPMELMVHGYELTLRLSDASAIEIDEPYIKEKTTVKIEAHKHISHPGLGEGGKYHNHKDENPLPNDTVLNFALAGNQNSGKTTLFNQLTGSNQHVGNFPGVTIDQKIGTIRKNPNAKVVDLPGIYSLSPYSDEEIVSRRYILRDKPQGIIDIVDATNIERNLYLTLQLMELEKPMTIALNMMDELTNNGGYIDVNKMEDMLGVPVVAISAKKNEGVDELISHAIHVAHYQEKPAIVDFCDENDEGGAVHRAIHAIMHLIKDHAERSELPIRFAASKVIEGDKRVISALKLDQNELEMIEHIIVQMEKERGLDRSDAIADMRYHYIEKVVHECVIKPHESKERKRSEAIDKVLTGKYTAIPMFVLIMGAIFFLTFGLIGNYAQQLLELGIDSLAEVLDNWFTSMSVNPVIHSLILDGVYAGVGSVLTFLPIIITLFFFLSLLEDSGYMARIAFVMDKILRKLGLSGKSIVPMLIGFGCTVPAVMSARTLSSERDRKATILLTPFMSCSAKLPIYGFLCHIFFGGWSWLVMTGLYFLGIIIAIIYALIIKKTYKGEAVPFVMELPNYRMPGIKNVAQLLWEKSKDFLKKAFTIILIATIVIWFLQTFNFKMEMVEPGDSMLAIISGYIAVIFKPLGFGDYRVVTGLVSGIMAKESVVSTLEILCGSTDAIKALLSPFAAFSLLVFCLLYTPCVAALASVKRELGWKWSLGVAVSQFAIAYVVAGLFSLIFFLVGVL